MVSILNFCHCRLHDADDVAVNDIIRVEVDAFVLWFRALGTSVDLSINYIDVKWPLNLVNSLMLQLFTTVECCKKKI